uniref:Centrosomal protein of 19 kDa n=1 Tax=Spongospora subterranea TaxID=70186 RepID=A0A0H5QP97_9EUKA|eukprot:CRZ03201.1 hypothetical protein [Spongospora subterranea]
MAGLGTLPTIASRHVGVLPPLHRGKLPPKPMPAPAPDPRPRIAPLQIAARFSPPSIALLYMDMNTHKRKIRQISSSELADIFTRDGIANLLQKRYRKYFDRVEIGQINSIIEQLIEKSATKSDPDGLTLDEDLNKVAPEILIAAKRSMNESYEQNRKQPGDADFQYDVQKTFQPTGTSNWDDDDGQETEIEDEVNFSPAEVSDDDGLFNALT